MSTERDIIGMTIRSLGLNDLTMDVTEHIVAKDVSEKFITTPFSIVWRIVGISARIGWEIEHLEWKLVFGLGDWHNHGNH